jgi:hypothetical protein
MGKSKLVDELSESRLSKYLILSAQSVLKPKVDKYLSDKVHPLKLTSEYEQYVMDVFKAQGRIINTIELLEYIPLMLKRLPPSVFFKRNDLSKAKYFQYQLENHIIRISTIYDQMILMTNAVFQLGIQEKKCSEDLIVNNKHTKNTGAVKCLKECKQAIIGVITERNLIVHRGEFEDSDLQRLSSFSLIHKYKETEEPNDINGISLFSGGMIKHLSRSVQRDNIKLMEKNNVSLVKILLKFFKSLENPISTKAISLHSSKST